MLTKLNNQTAQQPKVRSSNDVPKNSSYKNRKKEIPATLFLIKNSNCGCVLLLLHSVD